MDFKLNEYHRDVSDEELLEDLRRVAELLKTDYFSRSEYQKLGKYGSSTITRRFGSWNNAIKQSDLKLMKYLIVDMIFWKKKKISFLI